MKSFIFLILLISNTSLINAFEEGMIGFVYPDKESREFLVKVLDSLNKDYSEVQENSKITIFWKPENNEQEKEVRDRVSQYIFIKDVCPNLKTPLPNQESKKDLSC